MIGETFDKLIGVLSPRRGLERTLARQTMLQVRGYDAGKRDRRNRNWKVSNESGNAPNLGEVQLARWRAWELFRNNHICRKAVRTMTAQVVGCGQRAEPAAMDASGERRVAFNQRSKQIFDAWSRRVTLEPIGAGGRGFASMQALAFREFALSGEFLVRFVRLTRERADEIGLAVPLALQFIEAERLAEDATGFGRNAKNVFRGIEFDDDDNRVAYHIYRHHPNDPRITRHKLESEPIPADEILHVFDPERIGSQRGVTWFAPVLNEIRDTGDYKQTEMTAASIAACVTMWLETLSGSGAPTLNPNANQDTLDLDGNKITTFQPGTFVRLRPGEKMNGFNPMRPNTSAVEFVNFMVRGIAGGLPGVKPSTLTGDYRQASFSSERAADNDAWRETEVVQDFFAENFCQPVYERVQEAAAMAGLYDGRIGEIRRSDFRCIWHGPVGRSIQPDTDARAASLSVSNATSSPQLEAAGVGTDWKQNIDETAEVYEYAKSKGLPEVVCLRMAGIDNAQAAADPDPEGEAEEDEAEESEANGKVNGRMNFAELRT
jgi:lambda family phage portal protein